MIKVHVQGMTTIILIAHSHSLLDKTERDSIGNVPILSAHNESERNWRVWGVIERDKSGLSFVTRSKETGIKAVKNNTFLMKFRQSEYFTVQHTHIFIY